MSDPTRIALPKLCLWYDPTRIQTWPRLLSAVTPGQLFPNMTEMARLLVSDRAFDEKHPAPLDVVRSLPGLERVRSRLVLRGVGLLEKSDGHYQLSALGTELAQSYRRDPTGKEWIAKLAFVLLTREPRLRVFFRLLSRPNARLIFARADWFGGNAANARLVMSDVPPVGPFLAKDSAELKSLRSFINSDPDWALGHWRSNPLLEGVSPILFTGQLKESFSLDKLASNFRPALEVFSFLGIIQHSGGEAWLDANNAASYLGPELAAEFEWMQSEATEAEGPLDHLTSALDELQTETGYVVASELRQKLYLRGLTNPDKEIAEFIRRGQVVLEGTDFGQGRHGTGLYGDPGKQLIRLRVVTPQTVKTS